MNILQLKYIVAIVENDFNITQASKELFISQPALSKCVTQIEKDVNLLVFERHKGRLSGLTSDGQIIFEHAKKIIADYDELMRIIELRSRTEEGEVVIGIPPLVITALFADFLNSIKEKNPGVRIKVQEQGGHILDEMMEDEKLNFAVLVDSDKANDSRYVSFPVHIGEYAMYMGVENPLARKKTLKWSDLNGSSIGIVDESYTTYHLFQRYIIENGIRLNSIYTAYSSDYLFATIRNEKNMTIMPSDILGIFDMKGIVAVTFEIPVKWVISFVYRKKNSYTSAEKYLIDSFRSYFK
ncbi:LysR family transcriptional regulator [Youngiibacter multivorans]|uniref:DNA-binding transcriptional LysR family regulator n=1 Tax=Youngiibacter multivorans TaxID=937251 RepID=A0ABS4G5G6_9CLOT|nr:LysR family transcriptional regulator [Youngiibacter multivorans]MBP1919812.1 DNA-binding transcriptional LysR family regulator [Youngiibacter multivorans]